MTGIAILGAGIWARDEHLAAVEACPLLALKAVYSRSKKSVDALAELAEDSIDTYYDAPRAPRRSLDDLLDRSDIEAVIIALPITVQPEIIRRARASGKHVLSEKPIAPDVKTAVDLIKFHKKISRNELWSVGENFRFMDQINFGAEQLRKLNGNVVSFSVNLYGYIGEDDQFYQTEWRRNPKHSSGCLLDSGIHYVAALRYLLASAGQSITHVAAFTSQIQPRLRPLDTVHSTMRISNGNSGTFSLSMGAEYKTAFDIGVVTDRGAVTVTPHDVILHHIDSPREKVAHFKKLDGHSVSNEVAAFAKAIGTGKADRRASPEEALMDLKVLQAMLESGEQGGAVQLLE